MQCVSVYRNTLDFCLQLISLKSRFMKKSLFIAVSLCGLLFSSSCTQSKSAEIDAIKVEFGAPIENFTELIESVEYIPLETEATIPSSM